VANSFGLGCFRKLRCSVLHCAPQIRFGIIEFDQRAPARVRASVPLSTNKRDSNAILILTKDIFREGSVTATELQQLLDAAKNLEITPEQKEEQRRSFAFGNTNIENPRVTRETVDEEAEALKGK
jgi:hypothetical protein